MLVMFGCARSISFYATRFNLFRKNGKWIPAFAGMTALFDVETGDGAVFQVIMIDPDKEKVGQQ
jgi:hypothetical protein